MKFGVLLTSRDLFVGLLVKMGKHLDGIYLGNIGVLVLTVEG